MIIIGNLVFAFNNLAAKVLGQKGIHLLRNMLTLAKGERELFINLSLMYSDI